MLFQIYVDVNRNPGLYDREKFFRFSRSCMSLTPNFKPFIKQHLYSIFILFLLISLNKLPWFLWGSLKYFCWPQLKIWFQITGDVTLLRPLTKVNQPQVLSHWTLSKQIYWQKKHHFISILSFYWHQKETGHRSCQNINSNPADSLGHLNQIWKYLSFGCKFGKCL